MFFCFWVISWIFPICTRRIVHATPYFTKSWNYNKYTVQTSTNICWATCGIWNPLTTFLVTSAPLTRRRRTDNVVRTTAPPLLTHRIWRSGRGTMTMERHILLTCQCHTPYVCYLQKVFRTVHPAANFHRPRGTALILLRTIICEYGFLPLRWGIQFA